LSLKERGFRPTIGILAAFLVDYWYDIRYDVNTKASLTLEHGDTASGKIGPGDIYQPTLMLPLRKLFRSFSFPENGGLVDLGCGKGRVLFIASEYHFKALRGIEYSEPLCEIARENIQRFQRRTKSRRPFQIIQIDAAQYAIQPDDQIFYMFHPFGAPVLRQIIKNMKASFNQHPRPMWIIYRNPVHSHVIEQSGFFEKCDDVVYWGHDFTVFQSRSRPASGTSP